MTIVSWFVHLGLRKSLILRADKFGTRLAIDSCMTTQNTTCKRPTRQGYLWEYEQCAVDVLCAVDSSTVYNKRNRRFTPVIDLWASLPYAFPTDCDNDNCNNTRVNTAATKVL